MDQTWLDVLEKSSCAELCDLLKQLLSKFNSKTGFFICCPDELDWFLDRGLKFHIDCHGYDCVRCFYKFLTFKVGYENEGEFDG